MKYLIALFLILTTPSFVNASGHEQASRSRTSYQFSYTPIYQFEADLGDGGEFDVQRHLFRFDFSRFINRQWMAGAGLSMDYERWSFSNTGGLAGVDLWDDIFRLGLNVPIFYQMDNSWLFSFIPSFDFAGATDVGLDDSLSYGAVLSATYSFNPDLTLGLGGGIFERLDETKFFPYVVINWQINDRLQLTNPFRAGPIGPAGLELVYRAKDTLEIGIGGAYRSYRFRLNDSSTVMDGIGQVDSWGTFFRMGWTLFKQARLDLNGGFLLGGEITIEDNDANELGETTFDTAPFLGLTIRGLF